MLTDVFREVRKDFRLSGCPATVLFGREHIAENAEPSRVVFAPSSDARYNNGIDPGQGANPRAYMVRPAGCDIFIWAASPRNDLGESQLEADYDSLNAVINQTALSLYRVMGRGGQLEIISGSHTDNTLIVRRGLVYTMRVVVEIPIVDIAFPCGAITTDAITWIEQGDVTANVTVQAIDPIVPTGTVMSSMDFLVNKDS